MIGRPLLAQQSANPPAISVVAALDAVSRVYGAKFVYENAALAGKTTTVQVAPGDQRRLEDVLKSILYPSGLLFLYVDQNHYTIVPRDSREAVEASNGRPAGTPNPGGVAAPARQISGHVQDPFAGALPGATILTDKLQGTATNSSGNFVLQVPAGTRTLTASFIGYDDQVIPLTGASNYVITLPLKEATLGEVEVVSNGYTTLPKERATGAFSVVTSAELEKIPVPNLLSRLEGQAAGVQLNLLNSDNTFVYNTVNGDGAGRTSYNLQVRGQSTYVTSNTANRDRQPLVVVDGLPSELDLRTLNPDDVEQITFLKDAAAASIWGTRAANGVVVIQTKKGHLNRAPSFHFSTTYSRAGAPRLGALPLVNSAQLINYEQELLAKGFLTDPGAGPASPTAPYFPRYVTEAQDWILRARRGTITAARRDSALAVLSDRDAYAQLKQQFLRPAEAQTYDLSLSGGGDRNTYFVSASYSKENTNAIGVDGKRFTLTANQQYKLFRTATLTANFRASFFNYQRNGLGFSPLQAGLTALLPYNQLTDDQGRGVDYSYAYYTPKLNTLEARGYLPWRYNYLQEQANLDNTTNENNFWGSVGLLVPLYKGLSVQGLYSQERSYGENLAYYSPNSYYYRDAVNNGTSVDPVTQRLVYGIPLGGIQQQGTYGNSNYTLRGQLNYDWDFSNKHQINALAGSEIRQVTDLSNTQALYGYNYQTQVSAPVDYRTPYTTVQGFQSTIPYGQTNTDRQFRFLSYFANGAYTFLDRYSVSGSVRYDDYNNFGLDRQYRATPLWSTGVSWALKKEAFLANYAWLNNLTARATYGFNGNISSSARPNTSISLVPNDLTTTQPYALILYPANPTLRWEKTRVINFGLDFSLFDNRIGGTAELYYKRGTDLFVTYSVDPTYGFNTLLRNAANLNGRGVDLTLTGNPIRSTNWDWSITGVGSYNTNEVVDYAINSVPGLLNGSLNAGPLNGYPTDYLFVFRSAGLDNTGRTQVYDQNEGIVPSTRALTSLADMQYAGRRTPKYTGGLNQTVRYKAFSLYVQTVFKLDYVFLRPTVGNYPSARTGVQAYELNNDIDRRWRQPGDEAFTDVPGLTGGSGTSLVRYQNSDRMVERGDHVRLREVSLRYTLPSTWLKTNAIKNVSLSVAARNLGLIWVRNNRGIDPDFLPIIQQVQLPPAVSYLFSLNANF